MDGVNSEGQFKVTSGHPMSNGLALLYGHVMESSLDADNVEGQFKVTGVKINVSSLFYGY